MTWLGRLISLFPALHAIAIAAALWVFVAAPAAATALAPVLACYGLPLATFHLLNRWRPLREGRSRLDAPAHSPWWTSHQCQLLFIALPLLESLLQVVPGAFSMWLRLWGSRVGRSVYWTPRVEVADRSLLDIGDRVIVGHKVEFYGHVVRPGRQGLVLYVRRIMVGSDVFLGAGSRLGPGVHIADGSYIPLLTDLLPNRRVAGDDRPPAPLRPTRVAS